MLQDFLPIAVIIILAIGLGFLVVLLGNLFGPRRKTLRKGMPYESGMKPYGEAIRRIPVKFYLVAVLFILFDIETVFFLPWAIVFRQLGIPAQAVDNVQHTLRMDADQFAERVPVSVLGASDQLHLTDCLNRYHCRFPFLLSLS